MAVVLVDSSIWIAIEHERYAFPDLISADDDVAVCPMIITEVLRGTQSLKRYDTMLRAMMDSIVLDEPTPLKRFE